MSKIRPALTAAHLRPLCGVEWVVYAKRPFGSPQQVLDYLGRYTHRVAIANTRLIDLVGGEVRFRWRDYRHPQRHKACRATARRRAVSLVMPITRVGAK